MKQDIEMRCLGELKHLSTITFIRTEIKILNVLKVVVSSYLNPMPDGLSGVC